MSCAPGAKSAIYDMHTRSHKVTHKCCCSSSHPTMHPPTHRLPTTRVIKAAFHDTDTDTRDCSRGCRCREVRPLRSLRPTDSDCSVCTDSRRAISPRPRDQDRPLRPRRTFIGPIPWGHSGPLCHALSLSLSSLALSWTSMRRRRATVPLATSGEWA